MNLTPQSIASAQIAANARVKMVWNQLPPGLNPEDVLNMPFGGERNLAMRKAVGIALNANEVCVVNQGGVVQIVVPTRWRTREVMKRLEPLRQLDGEWTIADFDRPDGKHLVVAYRDCTGTTDGGSACVLPYGHLGDCTDENDLLDEVLGRQAG